MNIGYRNTSPDKPSCFELFVSTGWNQVYGLNDDEYFQAVSQSWHVVAVFDGDRLVGVGEVISDGRLYALVVDVIVLPQYRGKGIGTVLMKRMIQQCSLSGIRDVKLLAAKGKADFYRRFGFIERAADAPAMSLCAGREAANLPHSAAVLLDCS